MERPLGTNEGREGRIQEFKERIGEGEKLEEIGAGFFPPVLCSKAGPIRSEVLWSE
jgi:hypothetical protein